MLSLQRPGAVTRSTMQRAAPVSRVCGARRIVCQAGAKPEEPSMLQRAVSVPLAGMVAAALMASAFLPEDAFAASRSGGRVGGSSGFSSRRSAPAAPSRGVQTQAAPSVSSTTVVVAPAYSPFGFGMPFGGFGYGGGFGMPMFMPFGFFSSILSFMALALVLSVVVNVVKGFVNKSQKKDDSWGDL